MRYSQANCIGSTCYSIASSDCRSFKLRRIIVFSLMNSIFVPFGKTAVFTAGFGWIVLIVTGIGCLSLILHFIFERQKWFDHPLLSLLAVVMMLTASIIQMPIWLGLLLTALGTLYFGTQIWRLFTGAYVKF